MICFDLFYLKLLWSYDPGYEFWWLIQVDQGLSNMLSSQYFFKKICYLELFFS
jgi:hypothetical protein